MTRSFGERASLLACTAWLATAWPQASWGQARIAASPTAPQIAAMGMVQHNSPACASCHGFAGQGVRSQNGPHLAGLDADYLARQLHAFQKGGKAGRDSQRMAWAARMLTDDQIQALADYYASLPPPDAERADAPARDLALGRRIAEQGNWSEKVPPCASCHAVDGLGVGDLAPAIAGQRADYIRRELLRFRRDERRDDPLALMRGISKRLSMAEIQAVADHYASLPSMAPAAPPVPAPVPAPKGARR